MYRPNEAAQMATPIKIQRPINKSAYGVNTKTFEDVDGIVMVNFKTFGGTEKVVDGILSIEDTALITCWFNPEIKSNCRIVRLTDNATFDILGEPEDIEQRHQFLKFKVLRVKGGA